MKSTDVGPIDCTDHVECEAGEYGDDGTIDVTVCRYIEMNGLLPAAGERAAAGSVARPGRRRTRPHGHVVRQANDDARHRARRTLTVQWTVRVDGIMMSRWPTEASAHLAAVRFVASEVRAGRPSPGALVTVNPDDE